MNDDKVIHDDVIEDNVIHVSFGPGGGRRSDAPEMPEQAAPHKASESVPPPPHGRSAHAEPYGELFRREARGGEAHFGDCARHAPDRTGFGILGVDRAARLDDRFRAVGPVASHAGKQYAGNFAVIGFG